MRPSAAFWIASALVAASAAIAYWAWTSLPIGVGVPTHYLGLDGHRHVGASRELLWLMPFVAALLTVGLTAASQRPAAQPAVEPLEITMIAAVGLLLVTEIAIVGRAVQPDFDVMRPVAAAAGVLLLAIAGLMLVVEAALIGRAADPDFNVMRPVAIATGVLLMGIGNYLGKAQRNAVFGLRTPWTLADPTVWDRTHRFTGVGMVLGGVVLIALGILLRDSVVLGVAIGACTALPLLAGVVRSAGLSRAQPHG